MPREIKWCLPEMYARMCAQTDPIRGVPGEAESMLVFADGDEMIRWGEWKAWRSACFEQGRVIPSAEFKHAS